MGYSKITYKDIKKKFGIKDKKIKLFENITPIEISDWLKKTLTISNRMSLNSEKSRSEGIVAPFLFELQERNSDKIALFSGERLDVDNSNDLNGVPIVIESDFILTTNPYSLNIESPIFCLVEAKQHIIENNYGQCAAQMLAAQRHNEQEDKPTKIIYGAITSGEIWQFLKLDDKTLYVDTNKYFLATPNYLLGILQSIVDAYTK